MINPLHYSKTILAVVSAALTALLTFLPDASPWAVVVNLVIGVAAIYGVPNHPAKYSTGTHERQGKEQ